VKNCCKLLFTNVSQGCVAKHGMGYDGICNGHLIANLLLCMTEKGLEISENWLIWLQSHESMQLLINHHVYLTVSQSCMKSHAIVI